MNWQLIWTSISGIVAVLGLILTLIIEWPTITTRLKATLPTLRKFPLIMAIILALLAAVMIIITPFYVAINGIQPQIANLEFGRLGFGLLFASQGIYWLDKNNPHNNSVTSKFRPLFSLLGVICLLLALVFLLLAWLY